MSDPVNEQTIEAIRNEYRREVYDKLSVVASSSSNMPLQREMAKQQAQEFLCEMFAALLSALDAKREQIKAGAKHYREVELAKLRERAEAAERALTEVRAEMDEARLKLRIYENGRNVNQPLVDDIERWRVESEAAIGKAQQSRLNAMMERDTLAAELRTLRDERETMSIKLWALVKKWREDAQKLGRDSEQEGVGDPRASRLYGQLLAIGWAANNLEALLNDPKPAAAPSAEGGKA